MVGFSVVKPIKKNAKRAVMKKNPLKNLNLNLYAKAAKRMSLLAEALRVKAKKEKFTKKRKTVTKVISIVQFVFVIVGYDCLVGNLIHVCSDACYGFAMIRVICNGDFILAEQLNGFACVYRVCRRGGFGNQGSRKGVVADYDLQQ
ncbi:hypothetical protein F2Q70_00010229 [Brassica cretica]|uniref:Uncharacterized protein n=1 Tax=Brassica cretica TaxID=69181 RepID=A0A8S9M9S2_BRACR|nr:hypothetical protein F2Q70_00010229 [Brassica cretica]